MWMKGRKYREWTETCTQCARIARIMQRKNKNERLPPKWARKGDGKLICPDHIQAPPQTPKAVMKKTTPNNQGSITFTNGQQRFVVTLHRTLRIPEDGVTHKLPPNLGAFPIKLVDDYKDTVPKKWLKRGGVFFPMWQREAMWMSFRSMGSPHAVKVAAGKVNAVSGKTWDEKLKEPVKLGNGTIGKQDYLVAPPQPWLDGFNAGDGQVKQFVAMPLGMGYSVEKQVTGKEKHGGLQIMVVPAKEGAIPGRNQFMRGAGGQSLGVSEDFFIPVGGQEGYASTMDWSSSDTQYSGGGTICAAGGAFTASLGSVEEKTSGGLLGADMERGVDTNFLKKRSRRAKTKGAEMSLAAGGSMAQKLYPDTYGIEVWDEENSSRMFIHIVNSEMYEQITGERPPATPIDAKTYTQHGYPWFDLWDEEMKDIQAPANLSKVLTVSQMDKVKGIEGQQDDSPVYEKHVVKQKVEQGKIAVRDGKW